MENHRCILNLSVVFFFMSLSVMGQNVIKDSTWKEDYFNTIYLNQPKHYYSFILSYEYGPEVLMLIAPPIKLGTEYHSFKQQDLYCGFDASFNIFIAPWLQTGVYVGLKYKMLLIEQKINYLVMNSDYNPIKELSFNPKIGVEFKNIYLKAGPYIPVKSFANGHLIEDKYLNIKNILINLELGYRFNFGRIKNIHRYPND